MPRHQFKPGEKEAVAAVLGIEPQMLPDDLELEPEDNDEDEEVDSTDESEDDDDGEEDDDEDEDALEDDSEDSEDNDAEESDEELEILKLLTEWRRDKYSEYMLFSEFLKNRGK